MDSITIRSAQPTDLEQCYEVEISGFSPEEAASRETIKLRMNTFPQGFFVAENGVRVIGMINGGCTFKEDISDEELKQLIGHDPEGSNMVVFALVVLPEYRNMGIARQLMLHFAEESRRLNKQNVLLLCKQQLMSYYQNLGFEHLGESRSTHGGAAWHTMRLAL